MSIAMPTARAFGLRPEPVPVSALPGFNRYRAARTWQADDGWYAEIQIDRYHPVQLSYGSTEERALANLAIRLQVWSH